jgi:hypothetical protein
MNKKVPNIILLFAVGIIYLTIFKRSAEIFIPEKSDRKEMGVRKDRQRKDYSLNRNFSSRRNYFYPVTGKKNIHGAKSEKILFRRTKIPVDTLAVLSAEGKKRYLLKQGDKTWIE